MSALVVVGGVHKAGEQLIESVDIGKRFTLQRNMKLHALAHSALRRATRRSFEVENMASWPTVE